MPNPVLTSVTIAVIVFGGGLIGLFLHKWLNSDHLSKETQDVVRLATGMLSVVASLVLGLMVATVKTSFDNTETAVRTYAASLILLDETLRDYGDSALPARRLLRDYVTMLTDDVWHNPNPSPYLTERREAGLMLEHVRETIRALKPVDEGQQWLMSQALQLSVSIMRERWLLIDRAGPTVRPQFIAMLVIWIFAIFVSFGLNAPRNRVVVVALAAGAIALASAIHLILELDRPFDGGLRISERPMQIALAHMLPPGK
ncbi:MAG: hypothetical protein JSR21_09630 [Proteobacteria bacterium]|nr:hypothetical protein [Pseudomonadota bacterium]